MLHSIAHRGPDGEGIWLNNEGTVGLGHRRLSIIDLSATGAQPMRYLERYTITYNGEIYNYREIKDTLIKRGFSFSSTSDTEVLMAANACYGKECLQYLDGMFAFAIWDEVLQTLFCARDRFGEKPFYFHYDEAQHALVFASEMKALWAAGIHRKTDNEMLLRYLSLGWVQNPTNKQQTFYQDIYSLPPAHYLLFNLQKRAVQIERYWDLDKQVQSDQSTENLKENFLHLLSTSVQRRLRSDVAIGSSLSGGLDSSAIVSLINKLVAHTEKQQTFSAVFPGFAKDESEHIKEVVQQYHLDNFTVTPTAEELIVDLDKIASHQEEPFPSSSIYAQYRVYQLAKQHGVTVILDGQGADEILAGYHKYYHWFLQQLIANGEWNKAKKELHAAKQNEVQLQWGKRNYLAAYLPGFTARQLEIKSIKQTLRNRDLKPSFAKKYFNRSAIYKPVVGQLNDMLYFNVMEFGLEELLRYADRNSMAHSREVRLPFLNHELVQFAFSTPATAKIYNGFTKHLLRLTVDNHLPKDIVWRKDKVGFEPPQQQWMQHPTMKDVVQDARKKLVDADILNRSVLTKPMDNKAAHDENNFDWRYLCAVHTLGF